MCVVTDHSLHFHFQLPIDVNQAFVGFILSLGLLEKAKWVIRSGASIADPRASADTSTTSTPSRLPGASASTSSSGADLSDSLIDRMVNLN
ncbi:hypothetical protein BS78_06G042200 [Paspalum vaginatum]|nr:hypothetical protein BS78_06G042200 [Paspalum vaginatum]